VASGVSLVASWNGHSSVGPLSDGTNMALRGRLLRVNDELVLVTGRARGVSGGADGAYLRLDLYRAGAGLTWEHPGWHDLSFEADNSFGGGQATIGLTSEVEQGRFIACRSISTASTGIVALFNVNTVTPAVVFEEQISPSFQSAPSIAGNYQAGSSTAAGVFGLQSGLGGYFPGLRAGATSKLGYDGFHHMTWPPAGVMAVSGTVSTWAIADPYVRLARPPVRVNGTNIVLILEHYDADGVSTRFSLVAVRAAPGAATFAYGTPVTIHPDTIVRPLADGRLRGVWTDSDEVHMQDWTVSIGTPELVAAGAEVVVPAPIFEPSPGTGDIPVYDAWVAAYPGHPVPLGWAITGDEQTITVPTKRPPFGFQGTHQASARRVRLFGGVWEYVIDDTAHPNLNLGGSLDAKRLVGLRGDLAVIYYEGELRLLRVGLVADADGGVVGMVPNAG